MVSAVAIQMRRDCIRDRLFEVVSGIIHTHVIEEPECQWRLGSAMVVTDLVYDALEQALKANELCHHGG